MKLHAKCDGQGCTTPLTEINPKTQKPEGWVSISVHPGQNTGVSIDEVITLCGGCFAKTPLAKKAVVVP